MSLAEKKYGQFAAKCYPNSVPQSIVEQTRTRAPQSVEDVQQIVREAVGNGMTISVLGAGRCQGGHVLAPPLGHGNLAKHVVLDMCAHMHKVTVFQDRKEAIVDAGATWWQVQLGADRYGLAVQVMQASNIFSVGGSLSVNCHGHDHRMGSVANTVNWLMIVDSSGEQKKLEPSDELFGLVIGGYGMFGVIVRASLQLAHNFPLTFEEQDIDVAAVDYPKYFGDLLLHEHSNEQEVVMHYVTLGLLAEEGSVFRGGTKTRTYRSVKGSEAVVGSLKSEDEEAELGTFANRVGKEVAILLPACRSQMKALVYHASPDPKPRNKWMQNPIKFMDAHDMPDFAFWLQEYFAPPATFVDFCLFLGRLLSENSVDLWNATIRFVKKDSDHILMTYAKTDVFAIVLYFRQELSVESLIATQTWVRQASEKAVDLGGSFYLPYQPLVERPLLEQAYPNTGRLRELKSKYDAHHTFSSAFAATYLFPDAVSKKFAHQSTMHDEIRKTGSKRCCVVQ